MALDDKDAETYLDVTCNGQRALHTSAQQRLQVLRDLALAKVKTDRILSFTIPKRSRLQTITVDAVHTLVL